MTHDPRELLENAGIKPTPNRILVLRALLGAKAPLSLVELETELETLEKSSVFRVLALLVEKELVHTIEDGRGIVKYEHCRHGGAHHNGGDMHPHFYCEACRRVYCFDNLAIPVENLPEGFEVKSVNFMLKGLCPDCT